MRRWLNTGLTSWMVMATFATVVLLLVSADSYTHDYYDHYDSATFFASGKAWMSGLIPYVDFSDSKGPLLWLIYGVGYLLSPRTTLGVFWITCLVYAFIFWWLYKTASIYLDDKRQAMFAAMATAISVFFPVVRYETRAEDFALFFLVWALYHVCRLLHHDGGDAPRQLFRASVVLAVGMAATLLIKYNVSAMLGVMALFVLYDAWRRHLGVWRHVGVMALTSVLVLAPFAIYMLAVGCLDDFVREYFVVNMEVVARQHARMGHPINMLIAHRYTVGVYLLLNGLSALAIGLWVRRYRAFVVVAFLATVLLTVTNAFWLYYYAVCGIFVCFGVVALMRRLACRPMRLRALLAGATAIVAVVLAMHLCHDESWFFRDNAERKALYDYAYIMSLRPRPRIIYYNTCTSGFGIPVGSLPGCKYWTSQSGATQQMVDDQLQAIMRREADFVFSLKDYDKPAMFDSLGYHRYTNDSRLTMLLYSRDSLAAPPAGWHVTDLDVLLKRPVKVLAD